MQLIKPSKRCGKSTAVIAAGLLGWAEATRQKSSKEKQRNGKTPNEKSSGTAAENPQSKHL